MAAHTHKDSLRGPTPQGPWNMDNPMRPGKTAEDKRTKAWASKSERNSRQAAHKERNAIIRKR